MGAPLMNRISTAEQDPAVHQPIVCYIDTGGVDEDHPLLRDSLRYGGRDLPGDVLSVPLQEVCAPGFALSPGRVSHFFSVDSEMKRHNLNQLRLIQGIASKEEAEEFDQKLQDPSFHRRHEQINGSIVGTHVAGIAQNGVQGGPSAWTVTYASACGPLNEALIACIREKAERREVHPGARRRGHAAVRELLDIIVRNRCDTLREIAREIDRSATRLVNCSFGIGYRQARSIVVALYRRLDLAAEETDLRNDARYLINELGSRGRILTTEAPRAFYIFSAGNDGEDLTDYPAFPPNIDSINSIVVAATCLHTSIASFSNTGHSLVHVAAPGVGIYSSSPNEDFAFMSGTQQAASAVTRTARLMMCENPQLTPEQFKKILICTVDKKDFLRHKIKSEGIVNERRAVRAAAIAHHDTVEHAIQRAQQEISDRNEADSPNTETIRIGRSCLSSVPPPSQSPLAYMGRSVARSPHESGSHFHGVPVQLQMVDIDALEAAFASLHD